MPSARAAAVPPFEAIDILTAAEHLDATRSPGDDSVCHLEVGQPSGTATRAVLDAARAALDGPLGYTDSLGTAQLQEKISQHYRQRHNIEVPAERIAVTTGASAGVLLALLAVLDAGTRLGVVEPGYPCYANVASLLGIEVTRIPVDPDSGHQITPATLSAAGPIDALIVASPSNPTGTVLSAEELSSIHQWCVAHDCQLMVDEIYHGTSVNTEPTAANRPDAIVIQSFSKYFCMTGWRIGWLVLPDDLRRTVQLLAQNLYLSPPTLSQAGAVAAIDSSSELSERSRLYETNRGILSDALTAIGCSEIFPATGAFYVWADLSHIGPSREVATTMLRDIRVAATPGGDFDTTSGDRFVRFSVAGSTEEVATAARRMVQWRS